MTIISRLASLICLGGLLAAPAMASDKEDIEAMLQAFLANSGTEAAHETFWADDLVYTSSAGLRFGKADIMAGFENSGAEDEASDEAPTTIYSGTDVDIRIFGDTAIVAFKLVGTPTDKSTDTDVLYYFNTGTFLKRGGIWKVVAWQATKIPPM